MRDSEGVRLLTQCSRPRTGSCEDGGADEPGKWNRVPCRSGGTIDAIKSLPKPMEERPSGPHALAGGVRVSLVGALPEE